VLIKNKGLNATCQMRIVGQLITFEWGVKEKHAVNECKCHVADANGRFKFEMISQVE
jgi:hypothetical protein